MLSKTKKVGSNESTTMRVSKNALRMIQIVAAWKNLGLAEYVDHLVKTQGQIDLEEMKRDIAKF